MIGIIEGIIFLLVGIGLIIFQIRSSIKRMPDTVGWGIKLFILGITAIVCGIILIIQNIQ